MARKIPCTNEDIYNALIFLEEHQLVKHEPPLSNDYNYKLTARGFNVALENEKHEDSKRMRKLLISASSLLVIVTILNALLLNNILSSHNFIVLTILAVGFIGFWTLMM